MDLRGIAVFGETRAMVSVYVDDVSIFVSYRSDIEVVQKVPKCTKRSRGPRLSLRLGAWKNIARPGTFGWTDGPVHILGVSFVPKLQLEKRYRQRSERWLFLKGNIEVVSLTSFSLSFTDCLYILSVRSIRRRSSDCSPLSCVLVVTEMSNVRVMEGWEYHTW